MVSQSAYGAIILLRGELSQSTINELTNNWALMKVKILFYNEGDVHVQDAMLNLPVGRGGRVVIPESFKAGKQIIAVLNADAEVLNRLGDRPSF